MTLLPVVAADSAPGAPHMPAGQCVNREALIAKASWEQEESRAVDSAEAALYGTDHGGVGAVSAHPPSARQHPDRRDAAARALLHVGRLSAGVAQRPPARRRPRGGDPEGDAELANAASACPCTAALVPTEDHALHHRRRELHGLHRLREALSDARDQRRPEEGVLPRARTVHRLWCLRCNLPRRGGPR